MRAFDFCPFCGKEIKGLGIRSCAECGLINMGRPRAGIPFDGSLATDYLAGKTAMELASLWGCGIARIYSELREMGVPVRSRGKPKGIFGDRSNWDVIVARWDTGETLESIAVDFKLTRERIRQIAEMCGRVRNHVNPNVAAVAAEKKKAKIESADAQRKRRRDALNAKMDLVERLRSEGKLNFEIEKEVGITAVSNRICQWKKRFPGRFSQRSPYFSARPKCERSPSPYWPRRRLLKLLRMREKILAKARESEHVERASKLWNEGKSYREMAEALEISVIQFRGRLCQTWRRNRPDLFPKRFMRSVVAAAV